MKRQLGLTLVELLVVISVLGIAGVLILNIFTSTLKGSNKTQVIGAIKQNGQAVLETMDKTIRNADQVVCVSDDKKSIVVVRNGIYTRYRFIDPLPPSNPTNNGLIKQDNPDRETAGVDPGTNREFTDPGFVNKVCVNTDPMIKNMTVLTDTNPQTGVSLECVGGGDPTDCHDNPIFRLDKSSGFKDQVKIQFIAKPGVKAAQAVAGQIDPVRFETTITLR